MIYLDNAATTFPKPPAVYDAAINHMRDVGASAGRSAHRRAVEASRIIYSTREKLATLFNVSDAGRIVFTANATMAINTALLGTAAAGDRIVTSSFEHNSVMRPLRFLEKSRNVHIEIVPCGPDGSFDLSLWERALSEKPRLAVVNHGSNVIGSIAPVREIGALCGKYGVLFLVDAAQTAGLVPIDLSAIRPAFLACSGHKGLYGLQGTGMLYIRDDLLPAPLISGGTGSNSESDDQPQFLPDCYESGTQNTTGLAALGAGVSFVMENGVESMAAHGRWLAETFSAGLSSLPRVRICPVARNERPLPTLSLCFDGLDGAAVAQRLNDEYDIATRVGLHCAPNAHRAMGTFPRGTVRISFGYFNTEQDAKQLLVALKKICG